MKRFISLTLGVSLILFPLFGYTYAKGCADGVMHYRHSKSFMLTLYSAYMMGWQDGYGNKR